MNAAAAIELLLALINAAGPVSAAIRQAQAEGRALTKEELDQAFAMDDMAKVELELAIARADAK